MFDEFAGTDPWPIGEGGDLAEADPEAVALVTEWAEYVSGLLQLSLLVHGVAEVDRWIEAVDRLAKAADQALPDRQTGRGAGLSRKVFGGVLDHWPELLVEAFGSMTTEVLYSGEDGPMATAAILRQGIILIHRNLLDEMIEVGTPE